MMPILLPVPPTIEADPLDGNFVVKKGKHIELRCKAAGNPPPDVHWTKEVSLQHFTFVKTNYFSSDNARSSTDLC